VADIVTLHASNFRDPVATLRAIADEIEGGKYGDVGCVGVVVMGDTLEVFGMGEDSEAPSVAMVLHGGFMRLARAIEEHGR
jgi:hypothetical protein